MGGKTVYVHMYVDIPGNVWDIACSQEKIWPSGTYFISLLESSCVRLPLDFKVHEFNQPYIP